jgi:predicted nucleic acid-binding protein
LVAESQQPSDEELVRQLEAELQKLKVSDLLVQTLYTVSSLGYRRLSEEHRDLEQARLAIEALRALLPILEDSVGEELVRDFKQVTANLQLAYADATKGGDQPD